MKTLLPVIFLNNSFILSSFNIYNACLNTRSQKWEMTENKKKYVCRRVQTLVQEHIRGLLYHWSKDTFKKIMDDILHINRQPEAIASTTCAHGRLAPSLIIIKSSEDYNGFALQYKEQPHTGCHFTALHS